MPRRALRGRWSLVTGLVTVLIASTSGLFGVTAAAEPAAPTPDPVVEPGLPQSAALAAAKRSGSAVEVAGFRSETSRVLATPEGTLRFESYPVPRWTKGRDSGAWQQVDTRLRARPDGTVTPVATLADVRFSAGGADPAVSLPVGGGTVSLTWPSTLPTPRIEGDTAVYESVLAGVDLRLRALVDGFTWVLVVHTPKAAANPALRALTFRLGATGVTTRTRAGGGFEVLDRKGAVAMSANRALMWDSTGGAGAGQRRMVGADDATRVTPDRARKAELPTRVVGSDLVIVPDAALLTSPTTVYPVMIDPASTINKIRWGYTNSTNATRDDGVARVGNNPDGSGNYRSFFSFNLGSLTGKTILGAKFLTKLTHSWSCTATPVNLWRSADLTTTGKQTWDGPNLALHLQEQSANAHKPPATPSCPNDPQPDKPMEFANANVKADIIANRGQAIYTLALAARQSDGTSESTTEWWKKFDPALTKLTIDYNTPPSTPTAAQLSNHADYTAAAQPCVTGATRPMVRSTYPWLKATVTDPDGSNGGKLSGTFTVQKWNGTAWVAVTGWPKVDAGVTPGGKAEVQFTTATADAEQYRWQVQTKDTLGGSSDLSPWCEFYIDYAAPALTPTVTAADALYLESPPLGTNNAVQGGVGYSGRFTFGANGVTDVYDYVYQLEGGAERVVRAATLGGPATVWVTPAAIGENVLSVRSRDQAGNASAPYHYMFLSDTATNPAATWAMNEGTGATLANGVTGGQTATLVDTPTWDTSRVLGTHEQTGVDRAVTFNGTTEYAATTGPVVDTSRSFSVAAWVKASSITVSRVVLSQPGTNKSPFELQFFPTTQKWCFVTYASDVINGTATTTPACAAGTVRLGVWTHLTAVYDMGAANPLSLYVDGVKEGTGTSAPMWTSSGPLTIGSAKNGTRTGYFAGTVDDVRMWNRVVDPGIDLEPLVRPVLTGQWEMEDYDTEDPRQEADGSGYQRPVTLAAAPATDWTSGGGYNFSTGVTYNGTSGVAATAGPVVRTDQSYSVSAWVRWTGGNGARTALAQEGTNISGFLVGCRTDTSSKWSIQTRASDLSSSAARYVFGAPCVQDAWTHLTAVHDATSGQLRLYVNGVLSGSLAIGPSWHANGALIIGRGKWNGPVDFWTGDIDRVRTYQGILSDSEITALVNEA